MKLISFIIAMSVLMFVFVLTLTPEANADKEPKWEKYSIEKNLRIIERWSKKWSHIDNKDAGWNLTLDERLRGAQLWVDIQMLKQMQKCQSTPQVNNKEPFVPFPHIKQDWTGMGGDSNTKDNAEILR